MRTLTVTTIVLAATLVGCNEPPGAPDVAIGPEAPTTTDTLSVSFIEEAVDPNKNDEVTYTYEWTVDGQPTDVDGAEVSPDLTRAGQVWSVTVTPADDKLPGPSATATTTIENTPPTVTATIEPAAPLSTDDLNLLIVGEDVDGDTVNTSVSWTRDGGPSGISGERVPADRTRPGEVWEATVVPSDAKDPGEPFTVSVQIQNQAPEVTRVILRPALPYERSVLEAVPSGTDPDGDDITFKYDWSINGVSLGLGDANTLEGDSFDKGDTVSVAAVANDGQADSPPLASETVTILNTPPTLDAVAVTPSDIYTDTPLTCTPTGFADDDGDPEQYQYQWTINGEAAATTATLDPSAFVKGDRIVCQVTPFDGTDIGRTLSTRPVAVLNSLPTLASVSISPTSPPSGTTVTATVGSTTDADGDEVTTSIDWYVDGRMVASGATLSPGAFIKGQDIYALVTPDDGEEEGTAVKSNTVTSVNSAPRILSFAMTPVPAFSADDLGVTLVTDDWDGDTVRVTYTWTIDGVRYGGDSTTTVPASETSKGDVVELEVTTSDGTDDGDSDSASQTIKLKIDPPTIVVDPDAPESTDSLFCEITEDSVDADGGTITYHFSWLKNGTSFTGTTSTTDYSGDTIPASETANNDTFTCQVYASSPNAASETATEMVTVSDRDGQVRTVGGTWLNARYEECGSGASSCTVAAAEKACTDISMKVAAHASNGTTAVYDLGATTSCQWSISYYTVDTAMSSGDCLVGISNLRWTSCCGTSRWHGRSMSFGTAKTIFGNVDPSNSGYVSSYTNTSGRTWGCNALTGAASVPSGCSQAYVACVK